MKRGISVHRAIRLTALLLLLGLAAQQIADMICGWSNWPLDTIEETVEKQKIQFPSVTVCAEGSTLFPAVEALLQEHRLEASKLRKSMQAYVRIQWRKIEDYVAKLSSLDNGLFSSCFMNKKSFQTYCKLFTLIMTGIYRQVEKGTIWERAENLFIQTATGVGLYSKFEVEGHGHEKSYNSKSEIYYYNVFPWEKKRHASSWKLVMLYLDLALLNVLKTKDTKKDQSVMEKFSEFFNVSQTIENSSVDACVFYNQMQVGKPYPHVQYLVSEKDLKTADLMWEPHLKNLPGKITLKSQLFICGRDRVYQSIYAVYLKLVFLQMFDFSKNIYNYVTNLMVYDAKKDIPFNAVLGYVKEIDRAMRTAAASSLNVSSSPYSIQDFMDMMTTTGISNMKSKAKWNYKLENRIKGMEKVTNLTRMISDRKSLLTNLESPQMYPYFSSHWTSLSEEDEKCFEKIIPNTNYSSVCQSHKECFLFCKTINSLLENSTRKNWAKLMQHVSHPSVFESPLQSQRRPLTQLVPFCFIGKELYSMINTIRFDTNYLFENKSYYGYQFCHHAKQMITDNGICTTFNFPDYDTVFADKLVKWKNFLNKTKKWKPIYPEKTGSDVYEEGLLLVLDSSAFDTGYITSTLDKDQGLNDRGTLKESEELNNFKVVIHHKTVIPMFDSRENNVVYLNEPQSLENQFVSVRSFKVRIDANIREADTAIKILPLTKRKCRFEDETAGLVFFKVYSQENCLLECKIKVAKKNCQCIPWNYPALMNDKICNIFGNVCFQRELIRLKRDIMSERGDLETPPCGCYKSCRTIMYSVLDKKPAYFLNNFEWLNIQKTFSLVGGFYPLTKYNVTEWEQYAGEKNNNQFLFKYATDVFRGKLSNLNPNKESLSSLDIQKYLRKIRLKKGTLDGRLRNLALLYIDFDKRSYTSKTTVLKVTFTDMISKFGGTLGLFTGFSFLTLIDVFYWMCSSVRRCSFKEKVKQDCCSTEEIPIK